MKLFGRRREPTRQLVIDAWGRSPELHTFGPPAGEEELAQAEATLGFALPTSLRELYQFSNGIYACGGNLQTQPLFGDEESLPLATATLQHREWGWPIPDEVLLFGGNCSDELFGIWLPEASLPYCHPVIMIGEVFEGNGLAIAGTNLWSFLRGWSAHYLLLCEADQAALSALGLPKRLQLPADQLDDQAMAAIMRWSDPELPDDALDPYDHGYDAAGLATLFGR